MGSTHREIELKLHVPTEQVQAVERALRDRTRATRIHLQAAYFDTPDRDLAAAGLAWRVRREGRRWVQTLKASIPEGDGMEREEHNVPVHSRAWPEADPARHDGTPAGERLREVLAAAGTPATERFRTDIWRLERPARATGGQVLLAFDRGTIGAAGNSTEVCELEVELTAGSTRAVLETARKWIKRNGLWLDTINKAQRGAMVADGAVRAPVVRAASPKLTADMPFDAAVREMVQACLPQIMRNGSAIANGLGGPEHVHQARVGMRRLRTVLREFGELTPTIEASWEPRLSELFGHLGEARDSDVISAMEPELIAAGAPLVRLPPRPTPDPVEVVQSPDWSLLLLELIDFAHGDSVESVHDGHLVETVAAQLQQLHRRSLRRPKAFARLDEPDQHDVRKRLKRLRYTAELTASLFPAKRVRRYVKAIAPAQEALGRLNDLCVARDSFRAAAAEVPTAWFAAGLLAARHQQYAQDCVAPLRDAAAAERFWD